MHARSIGDRTLEFGVSGSLWNDALVMYDRETGSLWSHVTGECIEGPLVGRRLRMLPATVTTFGEWRRLHPGTKVLAKPSGHGRTSRYAAYAASDREGIFRTQAKQRELDPKAVVQGVAAGAEAVAIPHGTLDDGVPVRFRLGGQPHIAVRIGRAVRIYSGRAADRALRMEGVREGGRWYLRDRQTMSRWDAESGKGIQGTLAAQALQPVPSTTAYWFAWLNFFPNSRVVRAAK